MNTDLITTESLRTALPLRDTFSSDYLIYHGVFPLEIDHGRVRVAVAELPTAEVLEHIGVTYGAPAEAHTVPREMLEQAVQEFFAQGTSLASAVDELPRDMPHGEADDGSVTDARDLLHQPPVVRYLNLLLRDAVALHASDVHLECERAGMRVRCRVDGVLTSVAAPPRLLQRAVVSRLKLLAELDIAQTRAPQDGRLRIRVRGSEVDIRVSVVPSQFGESVVLRLLTATETPRGLNALGMPAHVERAFAQIVALPSGLVLATGPTGSGKTTTLHSALARRASEREKLISLENPVEYVVEGVTQVPVTPGSHVAFGSVLRSILRQDPDVIMVGEMRDDETAAIAVQAALTGHLVLSTLHTNDASGAVARLLDLGVRPQLLVETLHAVLAQRLVRRCCPQGCAALSRGRQNASAPSGTSSRENCPHCRDSGFAGRVGIYELLLVTDAIRDAILDGASAKRISDLARADGMQSLRDACVERIACGETTMDEMHRVLGPGA